MKDKYQIEESFFTFSFRPFYHYRTRLKWYLLSILIFCGLIINYYTQMDEIFLTICFTLLIIIIWFFLKEILFCIPIKYTFDKSANRVYKSNLFVTKKNIMNLDEVIIYQSSEMNNYQYKMGKKKAQFVKSYAISDFFSNKQNNERLIAFEREILNKIQQMITQSSTNITSNSDNSFFYH